MSAGEGGGGPSAGSRGSRPLSARERARAQAIEQAAVFAARERALQDLAVAYLVAAELHEERAQGLGQRIAEQVEALEKRIAKLHRDAEQAGEAVRVEQAERIAQMRELEAPEAEVAGRLGITLAEVRRAMVLHRTRPAPDTGTGTGTGTGEGVDPGGTGGPAPGGEQQDQGPVEEDEEVPDEEDRGLGGLQRVLTEGQPVAAGGLGVQSGATVAGPVPPVPDRVPPLPVGSPAGADLEGPDLDGWQSSWPSEPGGAR